jgi:hypothetical protein
MAIAPSAQTVINATITTINSGYTAPSYFTGCGIFATNTRLESATHLVVSMTRFLPRLGSACAGLFFCADRLANRRRPDTKNEFSFLNGNLAVPGNETVYLQVVATKYRKTPTRRPINLEISHVKKFSIIAVAVLLGLGGAAMAADSGENHQDDTNSTGPNPYMTHSNGSYQRGGYQAYAKQPVQPAHHHVVKPRTQR